jgi:hypothetical protein
MVFVGMYKLKHYIWTIPDQSGHSQPGTNLPWDREVKDDCKKPECPKSDSNPRNQQNKKARAKTAKKKW